MSAIYDLARAWLRAYATDGVPGSGVNQPSKPEGLAVFQAIADAVESIIDQTNTGKGFETISEMEAAAGDFEEGDVVAVFADILGDVTDGNGYWLHNGVDWDWQRPFDADVASLVAQMAVIEPAIDRLTFDRIPGSQFVLSYGLVLGLRAVSSTFKGWRGTYPYNNESFNGVWFYMELEADTSMVKLAIYEDSSTDEEASCTRLCRGSGWHFFKLNKTVIGSDISTNYVRIGAWVTDGSGRMSAGATRSTIASSGSNDEAYTTVATPTWQTASSEVFRPAVRLVNTADYASGPSAMDTAQNEMVIDRDLVTASSITLEGTCTDFANGAASSTFFAYSSTQTKGTFSANGVYIPALRRALSTSSSRRWATLTATLRNASNTGGVVATGQIKVDPLEDELRDIYIPFTDKSGSVVTKTEADIAGTSYVVQVEAWTADGAPATFAAPNGTIDIATASHYRALADTDTWANNAFTPYAVQLVSATFARSKSRLLHVGNVFKSEPPTITLAPTIYTEQSVETQIYLDNLVQERASDYHWRVAFSDTAETGMYLRRDSIVLTPASTGDMTMTLYCYDRRNPDRLLTSKTATIKRTAANAKNGATKTVLILGDSIASGTGSSPAVVPITLFRARATAGGATVTGIGPHGSGSNKYESEGGKTLLWLMTDASSPFVNAGNFDFANWAGTYGTPDVIYIRFGINSLTAYPAVFGGAQAEDDATRYRAFAAGFRAVNGSGKLFVATTPMPAQQDAWPPTASGVDQSIWNSDYYKARVHRYNLTLMDRLAGLTGSGIYIHGEHMHLDTVNNFPRNAPAPANKGILDSITGTVATYVALIADLTPADGSIYYATDTASYHVKVGPTTKGGYRSVTEADGFPRRPSNAVHMQASGHRQIVDADWALALVNL